MGQSLYPFIIYVQFKLYVHIIPYDPSNAIFLPHRNLYNPSQLCIQYKVSARLVPCKEYTVVLTASRTEAISRR